MNILRILTESTYDKAIKLQYLGDQQGARKILEPFRSQSFDATLTVDHTVIELAFGDTFLRESRYIQAGKCYSRALEIAHKVRSKSLGLRAKISMARILFHQKDFNNALDWLHQSLKEGQKAKLTEIVVESLGLIGEIKCIDERNFKESKKLHE